MPPIDVTGKLVRIGTTGSGSKTQGTQSRGKTRESPQGKPSESTSETGHVQLSDAARQLLTNTGSPMDTQRVAAIRTQVANGNYQIDSHSVARKIADGLGALLRRKGRQ